jgi:hypothetical protein
VTDGDPAGGRAEEERWGRLLKSADALALLLVAVCAAVTCVSAVYVAFFK